MKKKKKILRPKEKSPEKVVSIFAAVFSGLLILLGILTLVLIQKPLKESQDTRKAAFVEDGQVQVTIEQPTDPQIGQTVTIPFAVTTNGVGTAGIQLVFDVTADNIDQLSVDVLSTSGLVAEYQEVEQTSTGFKVGLFARPSSHGQPFTTSAATDFLEISFTPTAAGTVAITFDPDSSKSTVFDSNPPQDELRTFSDISITIPEQEIECEYTYSDWSDCVDGEQTRTVVSKTPSNCTYPDPVLSQTCQMPDCTYTYSDWSSCINGQQTRTVISEEPTNCVGTPALTRTCQIGDCVYTYSDWGACVNGVQTRNVTSVSPSGCTSPDPELTRTCQIPNCSYTYSDWGTCYNGYRTRTVLSVSPAYCSGPDPVTFQSCDNPGIGGVQSCNEFCDVHADCEVDHLCFELDNGERRCRRANNVSSSSCSTPPDRGLNKSCDEYCADSSECSDKYTCYWNRCRLPENPSSESCSLPTKEIVYVMASLCNEYCSSNADCATNLRCYNNVCRLATNPGSLTCSPYTQNTVTGYTDQKGGTVDDQNDQTATDSSAYQGNTYPTPTATPYPTKSPEDETALDAVSENIKERGSSLPLAMIGSGLAMILLVIFLILLSRMKKSPPTPPAQPYRSTPQDEAQIRNLQERISSLQQSGSTSQSTTAATSSMMDKVKQRGVNIPQQPGSQTSQSKTVFQRPNQ